MTTTERSASTHRSNTAFRAKVVQAASLTIVPCLPVRSVSLYGGLPASPLPDGAVLVELGDFYGKERRKLLLRSARLCLASRRWTSPRSRSD